MTEDERLQLTYECLRLLTDWGVIPKDLVKILAFPEATKFRTLRRYLTGTPFPDDERILKRAQQVVHIGNALHTHFPHNAMMGKVWMNAPHDRLRGDTPLKRLTEDGDDGVDSVLVQLDCGYAWDLTGSKPE